MKNPGEWFERFYGRFLAFKINALKILGKPITFNSIFEPGWVPEEIAKIELNFSQIVTFEESKHQFGFFVFVFVFVLFNKFPSKKQKQKQKQTKKVPKGTNCLVERWNSDHEKWSKCKGSGSLLHGTLCRRKEIFCWVAGQALPS